MTNRRDRHRSLDVTRSNVFRRLNAIFDAETNDRAPVRLTRIHIMRTYSAADASFFAAASCAASDDIASPPTTELGAA